VVTIPYQGYEAKYLAALVGKSGAPDFFNGNRAPVVRAVRLLLTRCPPISRRPGARTSPSYMLAVGQFKGATYGIPIEHGNFQQMYIDVELFKKAGLNPDKPRRRSTSGWPP